ncbi:MAG: hypothetical protein ABSA01_12565 [Anaerolineales bacterium]
MSQKDDNTMWQMAQARRRCGSNPSRPDRITMRRSVRRMALLPSGIEL